MRLKREEGTAAIELVMVAPALLLLLALVVAAGRMLSVKSGLESVAREAARIASQASNAEEAGEQAHSRAAETAKGLGFDSDRLRTEVNAGRFERGTPLTVTVGYEVRLGDVPSFGMFPRSFAMSASHAELIEAYKSR